MKLWFIVVLSLLLVLVGCTEQTPPTAPQQTVSEDPAIQTIPITLSKSVTRTFVLRLRDGTFNYDPLIAKKDDGFILAVKYRYVQQNSTFFIEGYNISVPFNRRGEAFLNFTADKVGTFVFGESPSNFTGKLIVFE